MRTSVNKLNEGLIVTSPFLSTKQTMTSHLISLITLVVSPRIDSLRKVNRFAPINRYYIIIDEVFFDNFLVIIYLLVCKKNNSFILFYFKYLFISCTYKKNNNSFILVYFCQRSQAKLFLQNLQKPQKNSKKVGFFCTNAKVHEMTKMLYKCANNLFFNELRIKC
jgi:hypothetical protein